MFSKISAASNECLERTGNHLFFQHFSCELATQRFFGRPLRLVLGGRRGSVVFSLGFSQCASVKESLQPVNMSYRGSQLAELCMSVSRPFPTIKCSGRATTCSGRIKRVHPLHHGASRAADLHVSLRSVKRVVNNRWQREKC